MSTLKRRLLGRSNRFGAWMYRTTDGRLFGGRGEKPKVLMITTPGRRTGVPRSTCVRFLETDEGYVVWGSGSGAPKDPDWFRNLRKAEVAEIQVGEQHLAVRPRELRGAEREAMWKDVVLAQVPGVARYEAKAGRTIPVAVLVRAGRG